MSLMQKLKSNMSETVTRRLRGAKEKKLRSGRAGVDTPTLTDRDTKSKMKTARPRAPTKKSRRTKASKSTLKKRPSKTCQTTVDLGDDPEQKTPSEAAKADAPSNNEKKGEEKGKKDVMTKTTKDVRVEDPTTSTTSKDAKTESLVTTAPAVAKKEVKEEDTKKKEKPKKVWKGDEVAIKFYLKCGDIAKLQTEFNFLESLGTNKTTNVYDSNSERNRDKVHKIYDDNRVVLNRPGDEQVNYINASLISVKDFAHKIIVAQMPRMENDSFVEDFWHMIYQEQINLVYLLVPNSILEKAPTKLFTEEHDSFQYVGKMFINNRRAKPGGDPKEYTIEVLPQGNSDSVMCQVHHYATWQPLQQPPKTSRVVKLVHHFLAEKEIQSASICVVSEYGSGRACSFVAALIAIHHLNQGIEPNILELMTQIKQQRPGATESFVQYAGIYVIVLDYIRRKRVIKYDDVYKELTKIIDDLTDISPPPTTAA